MNEQEVALIEEKINGGDIEYSIKLLNKMLSGGPDDEQIFILLGKAYQKQALWHEAMNNYQNAIEINPQSTALELKKMIVDIMNFYNKDMFNQ